MNSLGELYPQEQARLRELLSAYRKIPTGVFGAAMIEQVLRRADQAAISGDPTAMVRSYEEMRGCK